MYRMRIVISLAAAVLLAALAAPALAEDAPKKDKRGKMVEKVFARLDADKDGRISRSEAEKGPRLKEHFDAVDADKDGYVTKAELGAALDKLRKDKGKK
jgi:Ca2+-binding EF-hand superfamily protein